MVDPNQQHLLAFFFFFLGQGMDSSQPLHGLDFNSKTRKPLLAFPGAGTRGCDGNPEGKGPPGNGIFFVPVDVWEREGGEGG